MTQPDPHVKIAALGAIAAALIGVMAGAWAKPGPAAAHPLLGPRQELQTGGFDPAVPSIDQRSDA
jgi:hypothetical protein